MNLTKNTKLLIIMYLFILMLTSGKFFIGSFMNSNEIVLNKPFIKNLTNNFNWISIDLPTKIIEIIEFKNELEIDIKTKEYMVEYGIDNVRGGSYSNHQLEDYQKKALNDELSKLISQKKQQIVFSFKSIEKKFDGKNFEEKLSIVTTDYKYGKFITAFISKRNEFNNHRERWTGEKMNELEEDKFLEYLINDDCDTFLKRELNFDNQQNQYIIQRNQNKIKDTFNKIVDIKESKFIRAGPDSNVVYKYMFNRIQQTTKQIIDRYGSIEKITEYYDYILNNFTEDKGNKFNLDNLLIPENLYMYS